MKHHILTAGGLSLSLLAGPAFAGDHIHVKSVVLVVGASYGCKATPGSSFLGGATINGGNYTDLSQATSADVQKRFQGRVSVSFECEAGGNTTGLNDQGAPRPGFRSLTGQISDGFRNNADIVGVDQNGAPVFQTNVGVVVVTLENDCLHGGVYRFQADGSLLPVDPLETCETTGDIDAFIDRLKAAGELIIESGAAPVFSSYPPPAADIPKNLDGKRGLDLIRAQEALAASTGLVLVNPLPDNLYRYLSDAYERMVRDLKAEYGEHKVFFVKAWDSRFKALDGLHPDFSTSERAAVRIGEAVGRYFKEYR